MADETSFRKYDGNVEALDRVRTAVAYGDIGYGGCLAAENIYTLIIRELGGIVVGHRNDIKVINLLSSMFYEPTVTESHRIGVHYNHTVVALTAQRCKIMHI